MALVMGGWRSELSEPPLHTKWEFAAKGGHPHPQPSLQEGQREGGPFIMDFCLIDTHYFYLPAYPAAM